MDRPVLRTLRPARGARLALWALATLGLLLGGCPSKKKDEEADNPLRLENPAASPASVVQGSWVLLSVEADSTAGPLTSITADLTAIGGAAAQTLYDNGTNGDVTSGDDLYSYRYKVPVSATTGDFQLSVDASDLAGNSASVSIDLTVLANQAPTAVNASISRDPVPPGGTTLFTVDAADADGTVASVVADLTAVGGGVSSELYDDGTHGDVTANDGTYSLQATVSPLTAPGTGLSVAFTVEDNATAQAAASAVFDVSSNVAPAMSGAAAAPLRQVQTLSATFQVTVTDADGVASVTIDLSDIDGSATQTMYDDGTNGDAAAGDDTYTYTYTLPADCPAGQWTLFFHAQDNAGTTNYATAPFTSETNVSPHFLMPTADPDPAPRNRNVRFWVYAADADGTVSQCRINLSSIGGPSSQAMYDDGTNGDLQAGDWKWSVVYTLPQATAGGAHFGLPVTATDDDGVSAGTSIGLDTTSAIAPTLQNGVVSPNPQEVGANVLFQADASDPDGSVSSVVIDLSAVNGSSSQAMHDDGTNGDPVSGDGTYSYRYALPTTLATGTYALTVTATDNTAVTNTLTLHLTVQGNTAPVLTNEVISPLMTFPGYPVTLTADLSDRQGLSSFTVDLSPVGRSASSSLYDDGSHGDATAGDGTYTLTFLVPARETQGANTLNLVAQDTMGLTASASVSLHVVRLKLEHAGFLEDIHGVSTNDIYTAGNYGQVYHWDGTNWMMEYTGSTDSFESVWMESATSVYVGGRNGNVRHFDGTDWADRSIPGAGSYTVRGFWSDGGSRVYAVGGLPGADENPPPTGADADDVDDGFFVAVWDNNTSSWSLASTTDFSPALSGHPTINDDDLNDVFGTHASDIVAVGDDGRILHYLAGTWYDQSISPATTDDLYGVWGYFDGTQSYYWACSGRNTGTSVPNIYYYNGSTWQAVTGAFPYPGVELTGIYGAVSGSPASLTAVYVTGTYNSGHNYACVWRSTNGQNFSQVTVSSPPPGYSPDFFPYAPARFIMGDLYIPTGASDVWVTGHRSIQHYVASATPPWTEYSHGSYEDTRAIDVFSSTRALLWNILRRPSDSQANARQLSSWVLHLSGSNWYEYTDVSGNIGPELRAYTMADPPHASTVQGPIVPRMYAVRFFGANDLYGVGDDGHVYHWDGQHAVNHDFISQVQYGTTAQDQRRLFAIWGVSGSDFWYGGEDNTIYHYTGSGWGSPPGVNYLSADNTYVTGLWGSGASDVYAVTSDKGLSTQSRTSNRGDVFRWNGGTWQSVAGAAGLPSPGTHATGSLTAVDFNQGTNPVLDGDTFTLSDGADTHTFEFDSDSNVASGNIAVTLSGPSTPAQVHAAIVGAVNSVPGFSVRAGGTAPTVTLTGPTEASANVAITESISGLGTLSPSGMSGGSTGSLPNLHSVWGRGASDIYVVGDAGAAYHWDGASWSSINAALGSPSVDLNCVFGDPATTDVYILGDGFRLWILQNGTWHPLQINSSSIHLLGGDRVGSLALVTGTDGLTFRVWK